MRTGGNIELVASTVTFVMPLFIRFMTPAGAILSREQSTFHNEIILSQLRGNKVVTKGYCCIVLVIGFMVPGNLRSKTVSIYNQY